MGKLSRGFTLVEMIVAITITGIIAGVVAIFIARPIEGYIASANRAELTDMADLTLKRMALEIRTAVPNSIYPTSGDTTQIEFVPARTGGRYCTDRDTSCKPLDFGSAADTFSVLGPETEPTPNCIITVAQTESAIIYNTGQAELDIYTGGSRRSITGATIGGTALTLGTSPQCADTLTIGGSALTYASPSNRFQIIPSTGPIKYRCSGGTLRRYSNYGWTHTESGSGDVLASTDTLTCTFTYNTTSATNGLLTIEIVLTRNNETVTLMQQIHVDNTP